MELRQQIIGLINGMVAENNGESFFREPLVGFSAAKDPLYAELKQIIGPHHLLPEDILAGAQTVISFFIPFSKEVVESNRHGPVSETWARAYIVCNSLINALSEQLTVMIAERGEQAELVRATHTYDEKTLLAPWSHRSAAFIAGLGRFGLNRLLITPKGCAGRYGSVLTGAFISPTHRPEEEFCLYYRNGSCRYCLDICPKQALAQDGSFAKHSCHEQLLAVDAAFPHLGVCDVCGKCASGPCAIRN